MKLYSYKKIQFGSQNKHKLLFTIPYLNDSKDNTVFELSGERALPMYSDYTTPTSCQ